MRLYECGHCQQPVYFENRACAACGHKVGFSPDRQRLLTLQLDEQDSMVWHSVELPISGYRFCDNARHNACNWLISFDSQESHCEACRHNRTIPDLSIGENLLRWQKLETAKHYLFYALIRLQLPHPSLAQDGQEGLVFDFLADTHDGNGYVRKVMTGHESGAITINIAEADDAERELRRTRMGEPYRTLLGHFRHEIGHYYWDRLVRDAPALDRFRALFGDERSDYYTALARHYADGPPLNWQGRYVSAYASVHPWEDWAETWAQYLHIIDTLETAQSFGIRVKPQIAIGASLASEQPIDAYGDVPIDVLIKAWLPLGFAMNSISRSMGQNDLYPFVLAPPGIEKLAFIKTLIHQDSSAARDAAA